MGSEKRRHQGAADTSPDVRIDQERLLACNADRIVATATAEVFELLRMGASPRALRVVPCGVDTERFTPAGPAEPRRSSYLRIVTLSRLVERKGIGDVVEALARVPGSELVIAGGDRADAATRREAERLAALARGNAVAERVSFRGRVARDDVPALLRSADLVVCTPWYEPFGIVPLEAMACGVPVVVSAVGGLVDTVVDGVSGVHVPPRDPRALARTMRALARDPARRERLARAGLERARSRYAWARIAHETLDVYRALVSRSGARGEDVS